MFASINEFFTANATVVVILLLAINAGYFAVYRMAYPIVSQMSKDIYGKSYSLVILAGWGAVGISCFFPIIAGYFLVITFISVVPSLVLTSYVEKQLNEAECRKLRKQIEEELAVTY